MCSLQEHIEREIRARQSPSEDARSLGQKYSDGYLAGVTGAKDTEDADAS
jgi:hypothetical protein